MGNDALRNHIRTRRGREKRKQPFESALFDRINGLVRAYALGKTFLARLNRSDEEPLPGDETLDRVTTKEPFEAPLFSPAGQEEYRVTTAILNTVNNPYLRFAGSPDEILLCGPLFRRNPHLGSDILARCHFRTLLLAETAKGEIQDLRKQVRTLLEKGGQDGKDRARLCSFERRIERLRRFVKSVENTGSDQG